MKINKKIAVLIITTFMVLSFLILPVRADGTWQNAQIDTSMNAYRWISIAVDPNGNPHIAYADTYGQLKYASWTGAAWNIESVGTININGGFLSLVLDSSGNPHIAYSSAQQIGYISGTNVQGTSWTSPQTVASCSGLAYFGFPSLALDSNGNPAISYLVYGPSPCQIKYAHWTGSAWAISSAATLTGSPYAAWTSLAFDQAGTPHIAYEDMNGAYLDYATLVSGSWTVTQIASTDPTGISLGFNPISGNAALSYYDGNGNLEFATQTGSQWSIQTVDSGCGASQATSLAFDPRNGNPAIAYFDSSDNGGDLRYAYLSSGTWDIQVADQVSYLQADLPSSTGYSASLAFDSSGAPHIAYCENYFDEDEYDYYYYTMYTVGTPANTGIFNLPESPLGTIMALAVSLIALVAFACIQKKKGRII